VSKPPLRQLFSPKLNSNAIVDDPLFELLSAAGKIAGKGQGGFTPYDAQKAGQSPKMDTLSAITGGGKPGVGWMPANATILGKKAGGFYSPFADRVVLSGMTSKDMEPNERPLLKQSGVDATLTHEMGHRKFVNDGMRKMLERVVGKQFDHDDPTYKERIGMPLIERKAHNKVNRYYDTNPLEGYAQAFTNAYDYLDKTRRDPSMEYARSLAGEYEATTPGMGSIITELLKEKTYANHPLQGQAFVSSQKTGKK
jgi:hypothetical protein